MDTKQETLDMLPNLYGKSQITLKSPKTELLPFRAWPSKREYTLNIFENLSDENDDGSTSKIVKVQQNSSNEHENYEISRELLENCVGVEYGEWGTKGLVLIDGPAVDGQSFNHEDVGTGRISKSHAGNCHKHAICYTFGKHAFGVLAKVKLIMKRYLDNTGH